jgi:cell division initiation protein
MRITPLDIRKQEFRKTMRGLDADEVYAFLTTVAEEYEAVLSNNKKLRERIVDMEGRLQEYKKIETNLRNTLLTAERVTNETKENARREANLIVREAEVEAEKAAEAIRAHTQELRREVLELKRQKDNYLTRFKTLIESHNRVLEGFQEDFANIDKEIEEIGQQVEEDLNKGVPTPRISREKITEEFGHAPKDKVTWGDEPKREDTPRPAMPKPGAGSAPPPGEDSIPSEDQGGGAPRVSEAQTSFLADQEENQPSNQMGDDPIAAMNAAAGASPPEPTVEPAAPQQTADSGGPIPVERDSEEVRRSVARSIEEQLYPEAGEGKVADGMPEQGEEPVADIQPGPQDATPAPEQQDSWKQYDIEGKKTDWKGYDIEGGDGPQQAPGEWPPQSMSGEKQPAEGAPAPRTRAADPDDSEVEMALSGLKEVSEQTENEPSADEIVTLNEKEAVEESPSQAPPKGRSAGPKKSEQPSADPPNKKESEWSMEELRKNLSSMNRDEGN